MLLLQVCKDNHVRNLIRVDEQPVHKLKDFFIASIFKVVGNDRLRGGSMTVCPGWANIASRSSR